MGLLKFSLAASALVLGAGAYAGDEAPKRTLKPNMQEVYNVTPGGADTFMEIFTKGEFYGRLRLNSFKWTYLEETAKLQDNWAMAIGANLIYKSAYLNGFGFTSGFYGSYNPIHMDAEDVGFVRAGKDVFSRYKAIRGDGFELASLAQAYLEYKHKHLNVKAGRQIFESFLTSSNDTKMIPNTFEGVSIGSKALTDTDFKAAYLTQEKLRDHETFHHVLAYGDDPTLLKPQWNENDDSAVHKGLLLSKLDAAGIHDRLVILQATNTSLENLILMLNYTAVTDLVASGTIDAAYVFKLSDGLSITPAMRYLSQMDNGAGEIGGANLNVNTTGYTNPSSLEGGLFAAKVDAAKGVWNVGFGYSKVADKGDLVAPWRGFPTGGYTRLMAQYNWNANTKTTAVYGGYDFGKAGLISGLQTKIGYAIQNFDDLKPGVQADSRAFTVDFIKTYTSVPNLDTKIRMGFIDGKSDTLTAGGTLKADPSYSDLRLEVNYLF